MADDLPHTVSWSQKALDALEAEMRRIPENRRQELADVVQAFFMLLKRDPLAFGEIYRSRGHVEEHLAIQQRGIDFPVDTTRKFVLVREFGLSGGG